MSAAICLELEQGIEVITVDKDCSPGYAGAVLYAKYQTLDRVKKLMKLGDLYELQENLKPVPNLGHYILIEDNSVKECRIQEGVCISKSRDIRKIEGNIILKGEEFRPRFYKYSSANLVYFYEGVDYVYTFNPQKEEWLTWGCNCYTNKLRPLYVRYKDYIKNLVYHDTLSELTSKEKAKLDYLSDAEYLKRVGYWGQLKK